MLPLEARVAAAPADPVGIGRAAGIHLERQLGPQTSGFCSAGRVGAEGLLARCGLDGLPALAPRLGAPVLEPHLEGGPKTALVGLRVIRSSRLRRPSSQLHVGVQEEKHL